MITVPSALGEAFGIYRNLILVNLHQYLSTS